MKSPNHSGLKLGLWESLLQLQYSCHKPKCEYRSKDKYLAKKDGDQMRRGKMVAICRKEKDIYPADAKYIGVMHLNRYTNAKQLLLFVQYPLPQIIFLCSLAKTVTRSPWNTKKNSHQQFPTSKLITTSW